MAVFIAGTGTDVGKTLFSALVMARYAVELKLKYHKPIQTGDTFDRKTIEELTGLGPSYFLPEFAAFKLAASPHFAAESEGRTTDAAKLARHLQSFGESRMLCELAGGLEVPIERTTTIPQEHATHHASYYTNLDLIRDVNFPVVLVAANALGTINHTVLSAKALRLREISCRGVFFMGHENPLRRDNVRTIIEMTRLTNLGEFVLPEKKMPAQEFRECALAFDPEGIIGDILR